MSPGVGLAFKIQPMIKAILFDSDGVLVDTEQMFFEVTRAAFESAGGRLSRQQWARWYLGEGKRSPEIARELGILPAAIDPMLARRNETFGNQILQGVRVLPGVREALTQLAGSFRLAVVTGASRKHFDKVHSSTGLPRFFEIIVTTEKGEDAKPSPQAYLTALRRLGLEARECLAVEDSPRGAVAALAAGIECIVIPTSLTDLELCPAGCRLARDMEHFRELASA
jgi:HAD superfamily hydrolase (TIGR01509 family)